MVRFVLLVMLAASFSWSPEPAGDWRGLLSAMAPLGSIMDPDGTPPPESQEDPHPDLGSGMDPNG